ncbi:MAG: hypothetical protein JSU68_09970 [Phycisphaerales bacterium]|nr:MAG: hypothetical protein JSU68_09970 [Phycisphaerales bacterium]
MVFPRWICAPPAWDVHGFFAYADYDLNLIAAFPSIPVREIHPFFDDVSSRQACLHWNGGTFVLPRKESTLLVYFRDFTSLECPLAAGRAEYFREVFTRQDEVTDLLSGIEAFCDSGDGTIVRFIRRCRERLASDEPSAGK